MLSFVPVPGIIAVAVNAYQVQTGTFISTNGGFSKKEGMSVTGVLVGIMGRSCFILLPPSGKAACAQLDRTVALLLLRVLQPTSVHS